MQRIFAFISSACAIVFITLSFMLPLTFSDAEKDNRENFTHGIATIGTIVDIHKDMLPEKGSNSDERKLQEVVKAQYVVQENMYTVSATRKPQQQSLNKGEGIEIYYQVDNPKKATISVPGVAGTENRQLQQNLSLVAGIILLGFSFWMFFGYYAPSHKNRRNI